MAWSLTGFALGALVAGGVVGLLSYSLASVPSSATRIEARCANLVLPQRISLSSIPEHELGDALQTMNLSPAEQVKLRDEVAGRKTRLLWLTIWDWDAQTEQGDTISVASDEYKRLFTLRNHRHSIAIPEPRSGYLELRGERSEDGIIAISLLSGMSPIALPRMTPGQTMRIEIDTP
jgi:hypothetical protein